MNVTFVLLAAVLLVTLLGLSSLFVELRVLGVREHNVRGAGLDALESGTRIGVARFAELAAQERYKARVFRGWQNVPSEWRDVDVLVVGAGLSGAVTAERFAEAGLRVLVLDRRAHLAGNCFDVQVPEAGGIRVSQYGAHLFHTNDDTVWRYVRRFARWTRWEHEVRALVNEQLVPLPVNPTTVNMLTDASLASEDDMREWLAATTRSHSAEPRNSEDVARSRVGDELFELIFRPYTLKQWQREPRDLAPSVLARIPVHASFDTRYFTDRHQALPADGYTAFVDRMLTHERIAVALDVDFFAVNSTAKRSAATVFTGPIDRFFADSGLEALEYRSLEFEHVLLRDAPLFQPNSVVNYPAARFPFTRIVEHKHFLHQRSPHTIVTLEHPASSGEPYYPVPSERNHKLFEQYRALAEAAPDVHFLGRLAQYKYLNMDQALARALQWWNATGNAIALKHR